MYAWCMLRWCTKRRQTNRLRANGNWSPTDGGRKPGSSGGMQPDRPTDWCCYSPWLFHFGVARFASLFFGPNEVIIHISDWMKCAKMDRTNASDKQTHNKVNGIAIVKSYRTHSPFIVGFIVCLCQFECWLIWSLYSTYIGIVYSHQVGICTIFDESKKQRIHLDKKYPKLSANTFLISTSYRRGFPEHKRQANARNGTYELYHRSSIIESSSSTKHSYSDGGSYILGIRLAALHKLARFLSPIYLRTVHKTFPHFHLNPVPW